MRAWIWRIGSGRSTLISTRKHLRERRRTLPQASRDLYIMKVHASITCICARDIIALVEARTRTGKFGQGVNEESYLLTMSDIELLKTKFRMSN